MSTLPVKRQQHSLFPELSELFVTSEWIAGETPETFPTGL